MSGIVGGSSLQADELGEGREGDFSDTLTVWNRQVEAITLAEGSWVSDFAEDGVVNIGWKAEDGSSEERGDRGETHFE